MNYKVYKIFLDIISIFILVAWYLLFRSFYCEMNVYAYVYIYLFLVIAFIVGVINMFIGQYKRIKLNYELIIFGFLLIVLSIELFLCN